MKEKNCFKLGDVVKLKSGGPSMTVEEICDSSIQCCWFSAANDQDAYHDGFEASSLELVKKHA